MIGSDAVMRDNTTVYSNLWKVAFCAAALMSVALAVAIVAGLILVFGAISTPATVVVACVGITALVAMGILSITGLSAIYIDDMLKNVEKSMNRSGSSFARPEDDIDPVILEESTKLAADLALLNATTFEYKGPIG